MKNIPILEINPRVPVCSVLVAAQVARAALVAANPERIEGDFVESVLEPQRAGMRRDASATHLDALEVALGRYRDHALKRSR